MTMAMKVSQQKTLAGLFCFSFSIILASANLAASVDLCGVGKIEGKTITLSLNFSQEDVMKNGGECSRVVIMESARVKLVVEELNLANGAVFEIYDGPRPDEGQLLSPKADVGLSRTYTSTRNALFIVFRDGQGKEGPSSFRGKIASEPYQHACSCRSVDNGQLECSESDHERSCKINCQASHMDLSINKDVKCDLVKGEWDIDIHNMHLACQKVESPLQIKALMHFKYDNATCKDADLDKIKSTFKVFIEQNSDIKAKGVCFAAGGDENIDCKGKKLLVNCSGDKPARVIVIITDRVTEPSTLKEANVKLQELIIAYKNLKFVNVSSFPDLVMKNGNESFTPDITSASPEITPLCDDPHDYIKVPGNNTSFVCSTCPLHHSYNTSTHMCDKCPSGSRASSHATSCTKSNGTIKATPIKSPCSSACMNGMHVDPTSKLCEWCPQNTYQNSSTILNPKCVPCPDQKKTSFPGAQSASECRNPCASGSFYNASSGVCQGCPIGSYIDVDMHAFTKCKTCSVGKTTRTTGSKERGDCYTRCTPGQFYNSESKVCTPCGKGKYQDKMDKDTCIDCPANKTTLNPGSKSSAECVILCGAGQLLTESNETCDDCPINTYQDLDQHQNKTCKSCGASKITNATGQSSISQCFEKCSKGWFLNKSANMCEKCPAGQYQDQQGQEKCKQCPTGEHQDQPGQEQCKQCPTGEYQDQQGQEQCKQCPTGEHQDQQGQEQCKQCPTGEHQDQQGQEQCKQCPTGEYQDQQGQEQCKQCPTGEYQDQQGQEQCKQCPTGEHQDQQGQEQCKQCPTGEYQDQQGQEQCKQCPTGEYQDQQGQEQCKQCPTGEHQDQQGQEQCKQCPTGEYQDQQGQEQCKQCPTGEYQDQQGQEQCRQCPTGEHQDQQGQEQCKQCPAGQYQDQEGQEQCKQCLARQYQDQQGQEQCKRCPAGEHQDQPGQEQCKKCATGEYQDQKGQEQCKKCQTGEYQDQPGQEQCKKCSDGKTTENQGTDDSKLCIAINVEDKYQMSLTFLSLSWSEELKDKGSVKYKEVKTIIEAAIRFEFRKDQSFKHVKVTNLKKGSVIAEFDVSFSGKADHNSVKALQETVDKGSVGNLTVSPQSLKILYQPCHQPLGMENGQIKDDQITASTFLKNHEPSEARLNAKGGRGWHVKYTKKTEYLQIEFKREVNITGVATQGVSSPKDAYVTEYKLNMSKDGITWHEYTENNKSKVFTGNNDAETVERNNLVAPVPSQFIRFLPQKWNKRIYMRVEVYGCMPINLPAPSPTTGANIAAITAKDEKWQWGAYLGIVFAILLVIGVVVAVICWMKKSQEKRKEVGTDEALMGVRKHGDAEYRVIEKHAAEPDDDDENVV